MPVCTMPPESCIDSQGQPCHHEYRRHADGDAFRPLPPHAVALALPIRGLCAALGCTEVEVMSKTAPARSQS